MQRQAVGGGQCDVRCQSAVGGRRTTCGSEREGVGECIDDFGKDGLLNGGKRW